MEVIKNTTIAYPHARGYNCESASQRNLFKFLGVDISEENVFGLDASFGFTFFETKKNEPDIIVGKSEIFPLNAVKLLGFKVNEIKTYNSARLFDTIKQYIDEGCPLLCRVDMGHLRYLKLAPGNYFGGYFIVIVGYNESEQALTISDIQFDELQTVTIAEFSKAQSSIDSHPVNPNRQVFVYKNFHALFDLEKNCPLAIRTAVRNFLKPRISNFGLPAIHKLRSAVAGWEKTKSFSAVTGETSFMVNDSPLIHQCQRFAKSIGEFGSDGAFFRSMYSVFLDNCFQACGKTLLNEATALIAKSAGYWKQIFALMQTIDNKTTKSDISNMLLETDVKLIEILKLETRAFDTLKRF
ncbi:MAG: BtrH N-terminal domain-containing protein [Ferruginibacter sp.]